MKKHSIMRTILFFIFIAAQSVLCHARLAATDADRLPNFVVIFTDDQGYEDVGCFGSSDIRTPRLDAMAKQGMKFTSFYAQPNLRAIACGTDDRIVTRCVSPSAATSNKSIRFCIATKLRWQSCSKRKDSATGCFGKWDLVKHSQSDFFMDLFPTRQGFDYFYGTPTSNDSLVNLYRNEELIRTEIRYADADKTIHGRSHRVYEEKQGRAILRLHSAYHAAHYVSMLQISSKVKANVDCTVM